jgi:hypothetical protein
MPKDVTGQFEWIADLNVVQCPTIALPLLSKLFEFPGAFQESGVVISASNSTQNYITLSLRLCARLS